MSIGCVLEGVSEGMLIGYVSVYVLVSVSIGYDRGRITGCY